MKTIENGVAVADLLLDPMNPRLPEHKQDEGQAQILAYLDEHDVLDELIDSYLANGYFVNEPLLVLKTKSMWTVVEGNRRAAALMRLLGTPTAIDAELTIDVSDREVAPGRLASLERVPAVLLADRSEVSRYLGFRHISGLKTWGPEAKSRYLWLQVEEAAKAGDGDPFYSVGRRVGSNAAGVRTAYNAFNLLREAQRAGVSADVEYVKRKKFGVWTRLLGAANVVDYLGVMGGGSSYAEVKAKASRLDLERTTEVLKDIKPAEGQRRAILADSRYVTDYADVLANNRAREVLREYGNLTLAVQVVQQGGLSARLTSLIDGVEVLTREVPRMEPPTRHDVLRAGELSSLTRALTAVVSGLGEDRAE